MRFSRVPAIAAVISISAALWFVSFPDRALAQDEPEETRLEISAGPARDDRGQPIAGQYSVRATLTTADGRFVADRPVRIVEHVEFFGLRAASIGAALTDSTGYVSVTYQPPQAGQHTIVARFPGDNQYGASEGTLLLDATDVDPPFLAHPLPLVSAGKWLSISLAVLGVAFWVVLLGVIGRTVWLIRAAGAALVPMPGIESHGEEVPH